MLVRTSPIVASRPGITKNWAVSISTDNAHMPKRSPFPREARERKPDSERHEEKDIQDSADGASGSTDYAENRSDGGPGFRQQGCEGDCRQTRDDDDQSSSAEMWRGGNSRLHRGNLGPLANVCRATFLVAAQRDTKSAGRIWRAGKLAFEVRTAG